MATTQLGNSGLPSKPQSFTAKETAVGKGIGPFTSLSAMGLSGQIRSFTAKTGDVGSKGAGPFTALSVSAFPGGIHSFVEKQSEITRRGGYKRRKHYYLQKKIHLEELFIDEADLIPTPAPLYIEIDDEQYEISAQPIDTLEVAYEQLEEKEVILSTLRMELDIGISTAKEHLRMLLAFELAEMKAVQELLQEDDAIALILIAATIH